MMKRNNPIRLKTISEAITLADGIDDSLQFIRDFFNTLDDNNDDDWDIALDILEKAFGIKEKDLDEWLNNGGDFESILSTAGKYTNRNSAKIASIAKKLIDKHKA